MRAVSIRGAVRRSVNPLRTNLWQRKRTDGAAHPSPGTITMNQAAAVAAPTIPNSLRRRWRQVGPLISAAVTAVSIMGAVIGIYADARVTAARHGEKIDTIARELAHEHDLAAESRGELRAFEGDVRLELRRISDKLDGVKADRATR